MKFQKENLKNVDLFKYQNVFNSGGLSAVKIFTILNLISHIDEISGLEYCLYTEYISFSK